MINLTDVAVAGVKLPSRMPWREFRLTPVLRLYLEGMGIKLSPLDIEYGSVYLSVPSDLNEMYCAMERTNEIPAC